MKIFKFNKPSKFLQGKNGRNRAAFKSIRRAGFTPAEARRMLIAGNNIRIRQLARGADVTAPTIYAACYGKRQNPTGQAILAAALHIPIAELFPEVDKNG
jgi:DNA-binding CsgD family transcriptional regulator